MTQFTGYMARTMTPAEIRQFWIDRQETERDAGRFYYDRLIDADTGEQIAAIAKAEGEG